MHMEQLVEQRQQSFMRAFYIPPTSNAPHDDVDETDAPHGSSIHTRIENARFMTHRIVNEVTEKVTERAKSRITDTTDISQRMSDTASRTGQFTAIDANKRPLLIDIIMANMSVSRTTAETIRGMYKILRMLVGIIALIVAAVVIVSAVYAPFARTIGMAQRLANIPYRVSMYETAIDVSQRTGNGVVDAAPLWDGLEFGVDVSVHNGTIDWERAIESGVDFAILRCGYGDAYGGDADAQFARNVEELNRLGLPYGVYLYSYALNTEQSANEAAHCIELMEQAGAEPTLPVYYDLEDPSQAGCDYAAMAQVFCSAIEEAGYFPGVYASTSVWKNRMTDPCFDKWDKWVAQYNDTCTYGGSYSLWQYASTESVAGIGGDVDGNVVVR